MNYEIPHNIKRKTKEYIAGYWEREEDYADVICSKKDDGGGGGSTIPTSPTERDALLRYQIACENDLIRKAILVVDEEYRKGVFDHLTPRKGKDGKRQKKGTPYPNIASYSTWKRKTNMFIYAVATMKGWYKDNE